MKHTVVCLLLALLLLYSAAFAEMDTVYIPNDTTVIEEEAFCGDTSLEKVVLPEGILEIGKRAFADSGLKEINLPDSLVTIADDAFSGVEGLKITAKAGTNGFNWAITNGYIIPIRVPAAVLFPQNISEFDRSDDRFAFYESAERKTVDVYFPDYRIYAQYNPVTGRLSVRDDIQLDNHNLQNADFELIASYNHSDQLINRCFLQKSWQEGNQSVDAMDYYSPDGRIDLERTISSAEEDEVFFYSTMSLERTFAGSLNTAAIPADTWMHIIVRDRNIVTCEPASESPYMQIIWNLDISGTLDILTCTINP